jgi:hypothetical protein
VKEFTAPRLPKITPNISENIQPMESAVNCPWSNRLRLLISNTQRYTAVAAVAAASTLVSPALANKITFETASLGFSRVL